MAFESHGFHNYETIVPLSLEYSRTPVSYPAGKWASDQWYRYTRRATKTYIYRGMSEAALKKCLAEKRSQYMRRFISWKWRGFDMVPCDMAALLSNFRNKRRTTLSTSRVEGKPDNAIRVYLPR